jgi:hypothetical protein
MYGQPDITAEIKSKRLEWFGHVLRMEENRMVKEFLKDRPVEGERLVGPGSDGWTITRRILRQMKLKRWRNKATKREVWAKIVWEAKALHGL